MVKCMLHCITISQYGFELKNAALRNRGKDSRKPPYFSGLPMLFQVFPGRAYVRWTLLESHFKNKRKGNPFKSQTIIQKYKIDCADRILQFGLTRGRDLWPVKPVVRYREAQLWPYENNNNNKLTMQSSGNLIRKVTHLTATIRLLITVHTNLFYILWVGPKLTLSPQNYPKWILILES